MFRNGEKQLLIELHQDMKWLKQEITKVREEAQSEMGYKRCVARGEQLDHLEQSHADLKTSFMWIRNTFIGGVVSVCLAGIAAAVNYIFIK